MKRIVDQIGKALLSAGAGEISVCPHVRHAAQHFGQRTACRALEDTLEDLAVLGFGTAAMSGGTLFEGVSNGFVNIAHDEIGGHDDPRLFAIIDSISEMTGCPRLHDGLAQLRQAAQSLRL